MYAICNFLFLSECGKVYTASSGSFAHASYPRKYANSQQCTYTIRVHAGQIIKLDFDLFDLERSTSCIYDYIDVRDGSSASAPQLGKICGKLESPSFQSTGNSVFVKFQTDRSTQGRGFLARWKAHPSSSGKS